MKTQLSTFDKMLTLWGSILSIVMCIVFNKSLAYGFAVGIVLSAGILVKNGIEFKYIIASIRESLYECKNVYFIILLIGGTVAIWLSSGTVPTLIYMGFEYLNKVNFIFACFLISSVLSIVMGTALGTVSTVGIALYGIGIGMGYPDYIIIGAIVSGAFISDKISPLSALANLTIEVTESQYKVYLKEALKTLGITYVLALAFYFVLGAMYTVQMDSSTIANLSMGLEEHFVLSKWLLLLPLVTIILSFRGVKTTWVMFFCLISGFILTIVVQGNSFMSALNWVLYGFADYTGVEAVDSVLRGGGIIGMLEVIVIVGGAVILSSLFEMGSVLSDYLNKVIDSVKSPGDLILKTGLTSIALTTITCDQTVGILIPAKEFSKKFKEMGMNSSVMARTISDTGTIIAPLEPWNVNALILVAMFGVSPLKYGPFAFLCYMMPVITFLYGYLVLNVRSGKEKLNINEEIKNE